MAAKLTLLATIHYNAVIVTENSSVLLLLTAIFM